MSTRKYNYKGKDVYIQNKVKTLIFILISFLNNGNELLNVPSK
jgi:hypothetical protein